MFVPTPQSTRMGEQVSHGSQQARLLSAIALLMAIVGCGGRPASQERREQHAKAEILFQERCKTAGEFIRETAENVEGVFLINVRTEANRNQGERAEDQFRLSDPYGHDLTGPGYLETFLRDSFHYSRTTSWPKENPPYKGYEFVEAVDPNDGQVYRYTGHVEEPWQSDKSYLKGYMRFVLKKKLIGQRTARYGVKFEDISTHEERSNWIAGSSLKVIDMQTQQVIAERVGYMFDWAQGSRAGGRQPWTFAADHACPDFDRDFPQPLADATHKFRSQARQTQRFVEKVLKPNDTKR